MFSSEFLNLFSCIIYDILFGEKGVKREGKFKSPLRFQVAVGDFIFRKGKKRKRKKCKIFIRSYSHILLPIATHSALIWRVLTVLLEIGALPASRSVELVPHEGFEMSRKNPGTVIEIFRDNLGIDKFRFLFPNPR